MKNTITPALEQFYELKKQNKDCILWFRMWDFYEMFDEDAHIAHKVLWINITSRNKNASEPQPLAWIPYHAKDKYLPQLVNAWYKVAIAEQVSDPKAKWIVKREIVRVVSPATIALEWETYSLNSNVSNYIISITQEKNIYWISIIEPNTWQWRVWEIDEFQKLLDEIYKISPQEIVLEKKLFDNQELRKGLEKRHTTNIYFLDNTSDPKEELKTHFGIKDLYAFNLEDNKLACKAGALVLEYLKSSQKSDLKYLNSIKYETFSDYMNLDEQTIKSLDLLYNISTKSQKIWTLFWIMDKTKTPMWRRFLREAIVKPLQDIEKIEKRQDIIEEFLKDYVVLDKVTKNLSKISDLDNILSRLSLGRANPRDLIALKNSLKTILEVYEIIKDSGNARLIELLEI